MTNIYFITGEYKKPTKNGHTEFKIIIKGESGLEKAILMAFKKGGEYILIARKEVK